LACGFAAFLTSSFGAECDDDDDDAAALDFETVPFAVGAASSFFGAADGVVLPIPFLGVEDVAFFGVCASSLLGAPVAAVAAGLGVGLGVVVSVGFAAGFAAGLERAVALVEGFGGTPCVRGVAGAGLAEAFGFGGGWLAVAAGAALVVFWAAGVFVTAGFACADVFFGAADDVLIFTGTPLTITVFCSDCADAEEALAAGFEVAVAFFAVLGEDFV